MHHRQQKEAQGHAEGVVAGQLQTMVIIGVISLKVAQQVPQQHRLDNLGRLLRAESGYFQTIR